MQPLKTITDRGAVVAWSPLLALPGVLAVGTKEGGGGGFEEYGGDLTLFAVDLSSGTQQCQVLGRCVLGDHDRIPRERGPCASHWWAGVGFLGGARLEKRPHCGTPKCR